MPALLYGKQAYRREAGGLPELKLINMFVEQTPTSGQSVALLSRPGLVEFASIGTGPVSGVYSQQGALDGALFAVSGSGLYNGLTLIGAVAGSGRAQFAASASEIIVTRGSTLYRATASTLAAAGFADGADVLAVAFLAGLFVGVRKDTHRFYWSAALDATSWGGLDYASAESSPDELLDVVTVGDELWLLGQSTIEMWAPTGGADLPFSRVEARLYRKGVRATGCAVGMDNSLIWVGDDGIVYRGDNVPQRLSDHAIEERIGQSEAVGVYGYIHDGHSFFVVRLDNGAWQLDLATGTWSELASYGQASFRGSCATQFGTQTILGDALNGTLWALDNDSFADGGEVMERRFTALAAIQTGGVSINVLDLDADFGRTPLLTGQGSDPIIEMRTSDDAGKTWGDWEPETLGQQGEYRARSEWRALGMYDAPGFLCEFRVTDPVPLRISGVNVNDPRGGRAR